LQDKVGDPKKTTKALNTLPRAKRVGTRLSHLEGKEIFKSTKKKLEEPIGNVGDSHQPNKSNCSQLWV